MGFASPASSVTAQLWLPLSPCRGASLAAGSSAGGKVAGLHPAPALGGCAADVPPIRFGSGFLETQHRAH